MDDKVAVLPIGMFIECDHITLKAYAIRTGNQYEYWIRSRNDDGSYDREEYKTYGEMLHALSEKSGFPEEEVQEGLIPDRCVRCYSIDECPSPICRSNPELVGWHQSFKEE